MIHSVTVRSRQKLLFHRIRDRKLQLGGVSLSTPHTRISKKKQRRPVLNNRQIYNRLRRRKTRYLCQWRQAFRFSSSHIAGDKYRLLGKYCKLYPPCVTRCDAFVTRNLTPVSLFFCQAVIHIYSYVHDYNEHKSIYDVVILLHFEAVESNPSHLM